MAMVVADMDTAAIFNAPRVVMSLTLLFYGISIVLNTKHIV